MEIVSSRFAYNATISISNEGKYTSLTISSLDKLDELLALIQLNRRVRELFLPVDMTELLLEIDALTCFTREFSYVSESGAWAQDL